MFSTITSLNITGIALALFVVRYALNFINLLQAQFIAQSIGQAFQVAYMEFLKANGIEDHSFVKEMDYQEVLNSQEIFGDELQMFAKKELQKEVSISDIQVLLDCILWCEERRSHFDQSGLKYVRLLVSKLFKIKFGFWGKVDI